MVTKTLADVQCNFEVSLGLVSAKNALHNMNGYSPNQLVLGRNPNIPTLLNNRPAALKGISTSVLVSNNLNAMHVVRISFVENESSEKVCPVTSNTISISTEI